MAPPPLRFSLSASHAWRDSALQGLFVPLSSSSEARAFIGASRVGLHKTLQHKLLTKVLSQPDFDVNGRLDMYPLHIFSCSQLSRLFRVGGGGCDERFSSVLDIGSGVGLVTEKLTTLAPRSSIVTTEMSPVMCSRLRESGFECWEEDVALTSSVRIAEGRRFELVSMLNVLDRTPRPRSLLSAAHGFLEPGGKLLLATPLPFRPFFFTANHRLVGGKVPRWHMNSKYGQPLESLDLPAVVGGKFEDDADGAVWDLQAEAVLSEVLPEAGFKPLAFTRLPYVSGGDFFNEYFALDDLVLLAEKD